jgi:hypothetical protein
MACAAKVVAGADAVDEGEARGGMAVGGAGEVSDGGAGKAHHALKLEGGEDVVVDVVAVLAFEACVEGSEARSEEEGADVEGFVAGGHVEVDGPGGAGLDTGAAAGADVHIDEPGVGHGAEARGPVDGLDRVEPALVVVGSSLGADGGALATAGARLGVDVAGFVAEGDEPGCLGIGVVLLGLGGDEVGVGEQVEVGEGVAFEGGAEGGLVGEHEAEAAGVGREGVVEEVQGAADGGGGVEEEDGMAEVGEVGSGSHAGDAGADDEDGVVGWL